MLKHAANLMHKYCKNMRENVVLNNYYADTMLNSEVFRCSGLPILCDSR